jgi:hypothetical protein
VRCRREISSRFNSNRLVASRYIAALAFFAILLATEAHARCVRPYRFNTTSEGPWPTYGTIKAGVTCSGSYNSGGTVVFKRLYLAQAPRYGRVRLQEGGRYFYTAPTGYKGEDPFTLRICSQTGTYEGCSNIVYNMTVR